VLGVALISSDCLCSHTAHNRPFIGLDEVPGLDSGDPGGGCILLVGGTGRTPERVVCIPIVNTSRDTRVQVIAAFQKKISTLNLNVQPRLPPEDAIFCPNDTGVRHFLMSSATSSQDKHQLMSAVGPIHSKPRIGG
jgi:hypothetical protein